MSRDGSGVFVLAATRWSGLGSTGNRKDPCEFIDVEAALEKQRPRGTLAHEDVFRDCGVS